MSLEKYKKYFFLEKKSKRLKQLETFDKHNQITKEKQKELIMNFIENISEFEILPPFEILSSLIEFPFNEGNMELPPSLFYMYLSKLSIEKRNIFYSFLLSNIDTITSKEIKIYLSNL